MKHIQTRVIQKHDLEVNWHRNSSLLVPLKGELIIYDVEVDAEGNVFELPAHRTDPYTYERFKIGDGIHTVIELPFLNIDTSADVSLQELYDNNKLCIKDSSGNNVDVIIRNNVVETTASQPTLFINYKGYVRFKVSYGGMGVDTVKIDGAYVPKLNDEETVYEGYVKNEIEIYGTVSWWNFEYFKKDRFENYVTKEYILENFNSIITDIETRVATNESSIIDINNKFEDLENSTTYEDISLLDLQSQGKLEIENNYGDGVVVITENQITSSNMSNGITIPYTGYIKIDVDTGADNAGYDSELRIDDTVISFSIFDSDNYYKKYCYEGYVESQIYAYSTFGDFKFNVLQSAEYRSSLMTAEDRLKLNNSASSSEVNNKIEETSNYLLQIINDNQSSLWDGINNTNQQIYEVDSSIREELATNYLNISETNIKLDEVNTNMVNYVSGELGQYTPTYVLDEKFNRLNMSVVEATTLHELYNTGIMEFGTEITPEITGNQLDFGFGSSNSINIPYTGDIILDVSIADDSYVAEFTIDGQPVQLTVVNPDESPFMQRGRYEGHVNNGIYLYSTFGRIIFNEINMTISKNSLMTPEEREKLAASMTEEQVESKFAELVDSAPETLNTLNELAAALGNDENFATTVATELGKKVDKETLDNALSQKSQVQIVIWEEND